MSKIPRDIPSQLLGIAELLFNIEDYFNTVFFAGAAAEMAARSLAESRGKKFPRAHILPSSALSPSAPEEGTTPPEIFRSCLAKGEEKLADEFDRLHEEYLRLGSLDISRKEAGEYLSRVREFIKEIHELLGQWSS